jgi:heme A synthase
MVTFWPILSSNFKTTTMKKSNRLILAALVLVLALGTIVLTSSASGKNKTIPSPTCCKKIESKCTPETRKNSSGELIMDNMSRQFISIFSFTN